MVKNLGRIAFKVMSMVNDKRETAGRLDDDLRAFGAPSECYADVFDGWEDEVQLEAMRIVHHHGIPFSLFCKELKERCDGYWLHKTGLDEILPAEKCW